MTRQQLLIANIDEMLRVNGWMLQTIAKRMLLNESTPAAALGCLQSMLTEHIEEKEMQVRAQA